MNFGAKREKIDQPPHVQPLVHLKARLRPKLAHGLVICQCLTLTTSGSPASDSTTVAEAPLSRRVCGPYPTCLRPSSRRVFEVCTSGRTVALCPSFPACAGKHVAALGSPATRRTYELRSFTKLSLTDRPVYILSASCITSPIDPVVQLATGVHLELPALHNDRSIVLAVQRVSTLSRSRSYGGSDEMLFANPWAFLPRLKQLFSVQRARLTRVGKLDGLELAAGHEVRPTALAHAAQLTIKLNHQYATVLVSLKVSAFPPIVAPSRVARHRGRAAEWSRPRRLGAALMETGAQTLFVTPRPTLEPRAVLGPANDAGNTVEASPTRLRSPAWRVEPAAVNAVWELESPSENADGPLSAAENARARERRCRRPAGVFVLGLTAIPLSQPSRRGGTF
ncbi:hypothetical protein AURDEDRAFT_161486 [Auricularia subglabra TFB-10046 SS5]|nr:hypothetical protein AURDEDRAFT_161486 [Auricularia subglabra TFB-10046 SS5]